MSWLRFAPRQWTKSHMRLFVALNKAGIPFQSEVLIRCGVHGFYADFLISPNLVAEVDGASHLRENRRLKDEWRDGVLREYGFQVLRFTDSQVDGDVDSCVKRIREKYEHHLTH